MLRRCANLLLSELPVDRCPKIHTIDYSFFGDQTQNSEWSKKKICSNKKEKKKHQVLGQRLKRSASALVVTIVTENYGVLVVMATDILCHVQRRRRRKVF